MTFDKLRKGYKILQILAIAVVSIVVIWCTIALISCSKSKDVEVKYCAVLVGNTWKHADDNYEIYVDENGPYTMFIQVETSKSEYYVSLSFEINGIAYDAGCIEVDDAYTYRTFGCNIYNIPQKGSYCISSVTTTDKDGNQNKSSLDYSFTII